MRPGDQGIGVLGVDAHHQPALSAGRDRHGAADEEGQASEYSLSVTSGSPPISSRMRLARSSS